MTTARERLQQSAEANNWVNHTNYPPTYDEFRRGQLTVTVHYSKTGIVQYASKYWAQKGGVPSIGICEAGLGRVEASLGLGDRFKRQIVRSWLTFSAVQS